MKHIRSVSQMRAPAPALGGLYDAGRLGYNFGFCWGRYKYIKQNFGQGELPDECPAYIPFKFD